MLLAFIYYLFLELPESVIQSLTLLWEISQSVIFLLFLSLSSSIPIIYMLHLLYTHSPWIFCFVFVFVLFIFQFSRILLIDPLAQRFLSHVLYTESIKGILHFCYSGFHLWYFFLVVFRISISLMLFSCCCLLSTLSFSPRVA